MNLSSATASPMLVADSMPMSSWSAMMVPLPSNSTHMSSVTPIPPVPGLGCGQGHGASFGLGSSALLNGSFNVLGS